METSHAKGYSTELYCMAKLTEMGYQCSVPYANLAPYDFIVEMKDGFKTVQCKACTFCEDSLLIDIRQKYDVDYIGTYYDNQVYLVPYNGQRTIRLYLSTDDSRIFADQFNVVNTLPTETKKEQPQNEAAPFYQNVIVNGSSQLVSIDTGNTPT